MNKNKNYPKIPFLFLMLFMTVQLFAQNEKNTFSAYAKFISKNLDIMWRKPDGFVDLKTSTSWGPNGTKGVGFRYRSVLQSKDKECLIMYPNISLLVDDKIKWNEDLSRVQMIGEINRALGLADKKRTDTDPITFDFDKYVKVLIGKDARKRFNADTVFIAQIPLSKPYLEKYPYCTGIYVCKKQRPPLFFKYFFSEEGKSNESSYLDEFYKTVRYRNENWTLDKASYEKDYYKLYRKTKEFQ